MFGRCVCLSVLHGGCRFSLGGFGNAQEQKRGNPVTGNPVTGALYPDLCDRRCARARDVAPITGFVGNRAYVACQRCGAGAANRVQLAQPPAATPAGLAMWYYHTACCNQLFLWVKPGAGEANRTPDPNLGKACQRIYGGLRRLA
jgi:hypothetical protein